MSDLFSKLMEINMVTWSILVYIAILCIISLVKGSKQKTSTISTKVLVYGGMCVALSFVLSYIRIFKMPQGGTITLASMFPIILYALVFGPMAGITAGIAYGFLQLIQDPSVVHWAQLQLDYPLAFACLGFAGFAPKFSKNIKLGTTLGILIAVFARGTMHFLSGVIFFAEYAGDQPVLLYSLVYNASYLIPELIITLILALIIISTPVYSQLKNSTLVQH